jgi:stage II sporulation protein D
MPRRRAPSKRGPRGSTRRAIIAAIAVGTGVAGSCRSVPRRTTPLAPSLPQPALESLVSPPVVRVGILTEAARASVGADGGLAVWGRAPGGATRRFSVQRATFLPVAAASVIHRFRVQVGSLTDEQSAQELASRAQSVAGGQPASIRFNPETRTHQVRVGDLSSREEAQELARRLERGGLSGGWVVEEDAPAATGRIRLVETNEELASAVLLPTRRDEFLSVDGTAYRGVVEVRAGDAAGLTVINALNLEDYLRGVVPNELSPVAFPQLEALKAQAVAARTYVVRNHGQFEAKGYDICATPACQVYRGRSSENPLSDQAVEQTRGIAAFYRGAPINALYTSTCGGHTEEGANIFEGEAVPYLHGVACSPEREAFSVVRTKAPVGPATARSARSDRKGAALVPPADPAEPEGPSRDAALLAALGVIDGRQAAAPLRGVPSEDELRGWMGRLATVTGRKTCGGAPEPPLVRRGAFFGQLVQALCWEERGRRLLSPSDADYLLQVEDRAELGTDGERLAAAVLVQEAVLSPFPDNTLRVNAAITRAQAVTMLARAVEKAAPAALMSGEFRTATASEMMVKRGDATEAFPLDPAVRLFRALDGSRQAVSELTVVAGEKVRYVLQDGRVVFLEAEQSRLGAAADRSSRYYRWEVRLTPEEVARAVSRYGDVGTVKDVTVMKLGVSGRVVELAVIGTRGQLVLKGLKVRWALGLRENLFVIDREQDAASNVKRFVFTGKGWGHGVGLCQVGASGMAVAGASYDTILKHYYSGISLESMR